MTPSAHTYRLLLVEDNPADMRLMQEAIRHAGLEQVAASTPCYSAEDCMHRLDEVYRRHQAYHLIMLDLNMPRTSGKELIRMIRADRRYRRVPVMVFTNSDSPRDMQDCMLLGADMYVQKPSDFSRQIALFESIRDSLLTLHRVDRDAISSRVPGMQQRAAL